MFMNQETIAFIVALILGVIMIIHPTFVLFKPSRRGKWLHNMIGDKNWTTFIRVFGAVLSIASIIFIATDLGLL